MCKEWQDVRRLLIVNLGDVEETLGLQPILKQINHALPGVEVTLMAACRATDLEPLRSWVQAVLTYPTGRQDAGAHTQAREAALVSGDPRQEARLVERIRAAQFDASLILTSASQSPYLPAYLCYLAGVPIRVGQSKEFGGGLLSHWVKPLADSGPTSGAGEPDSRGGLDRHLFLLESVGLGHRNQVFGNKLVSSGHESEERG